MRIQPNNINDFFQEFEWPMDQGGRQGTGKAVFEKACKDGSFNCSASECLGSFMVLQLFLTLQVLPVAPNHVRNCILSFWALCSVLRMLLTLSTNRVTGDDLHEAILRHLKLCQLAYGVSGWRPKHHMTLHLGGMLTRFGYLVSCWTHERKHRETKRYANFLNNTRGFDRSVTRDILWSQYSALGDESSYPAVGSSDLLAPNSL